MGQLTNKELKSASVTKLGKTAISYDRIKQALANEIFEKFPRAPLATLIWILRVEKVPTEFVKEVATAVEKFFQKKEIRFSMQWHPLFIGK